MRPLDKSLADSLSQKLLSYSSTVRNLPGLVPTGYQDSFLEQLVESIRRIKYIDTIKSRPIDPLRADPNSDLFDPLKAALLSQRAGDLDNAIWLVFLSVYTGKHLEDGWRLCRSIYGQLGASPLRWGNVITDPSQVRLWMSTNLARFKSDGLGRRFSSHRKYETLKNSQSRGLAAAVESYVNWVGRNRGHSQLLASAEAEVGSAPEELFDYLYKNMDITTFGRLAKFDFLTMVGKLGLARISPGSPYLKGATGPLRGASLLFRNNYDIADPISTLDDWTVDLGKYLGVGMQVMEDSLCNWQKSPGQFVPFRG